MRALLRRHLSTIAVAFVTALVTAGGPAIAATVADYAKNADKVDGKHAVSASATRADRAGRLVATNSVGLLPNDILAKAPDADRVDGKHAVGYGASVDDRKGKLVATSATTGKLPNDILAAALNLQCAGCVSAGELDETAATQAELDVVASTATDAHSAAGTAQQSANDAAAAAGAAQQSATDAATDLAALRAGLASGTRLLTASSLTTTTASSLKQFTVDVPAPGTLTLILSARYFFDHDAFSAAARLSWGEMGVCDGATFSFASCGPTAETPIYYEDPDNTNGTNEIPTAVLMRTVEVGDAGPRVFHIVGRSGNASSHFSLFYGSTVTAMWTPSNLSITSP